MPRTVSRDPSSAPSKTKKGRAPKKEETQLEQDLWPCRTFHVRQWGHLLEKKEGSHQASVKKLLSTLKDGRIMTEQPLRLCALQRLTPAAATGHRGALAAQANALLDRQKVVRECALDALWEAAGHKRPEPGGAVHAQLQNVLPPEDARFRVESRRATADALMRLGPKGDETLLSIVRDWLEDEDPEVRALASQATGVMGSTVADVERLAPLLEDKNWRVVKGCIDALEQISGGDGVRYKCGRPDTKENSRRTLGTSSSSSKLMSRTMPNLLSVSSTNTDKNSQPSSRASTPSRLEKPERPASKRSSSRGSKRSSMQSDASASFHRSESSRSDTMPKASATLVAASAALAGPCVQGELMGLPRADAVAALRRVAPWGHQPSLEAAAARLRDTDAEVRREAVLAVAECGFPV